MQSCTMMCSNTKESIETLRILIPCTLQGCTMQGVHGCSQSEAYLLRTLSFKENYCDKNCGKVQKCAGEVVNVVCQVQAHHTKCTQCQCTAGIKECLLLTTVVDPGKMKGGLQTNEYTVQVVKIACSANFFGVMPTSGHTLCSKTRKIPFSAII